MKNHSHIWRVLTGLACIVFLFVFLSAAGAETPLVKTQAPAYYRMMVGQFEITDLSDGFIDLEASLIHDIFQDRMSDFWLSDESLAKAPAEMNIWYQMARKAANPIRPWADGKPLKASHPFRASRPCP